MKTYILVMQKNHNGTTYFKVGKTTDLKKRLRIYQLHNPAITDILIYDGDIEEDVLFDFRWLRVKNYSGRDSEWILVDYEFICETLIDEFNFESFQRQLEGGETIEGRMKHYLESVKFL